MKTITVRVPAMVTADGKWAVNGSSGLAKEESVDWSWLDEMCDHENPTICPQRVWITVELPVPQELEVTATAATD